MVHAAHGTDASPGPAEHPGLLGSPCPPLFPSGGERPACWPGSSRRSCAGAGLQPPAGPRLLCPQNFIFPMPAITLEAGCGQPGFDSLAPSQAWPFPSLGETGELEPAADLDDLLRSTGWDFLLPPPCESCEGPGARGHKGSLGSSALPRLILLSWRRGQTERKWRQNNSLFSPGWVSEDFCAGPAAALIIGEG